jgi:hypothetical protein
MTMSFAPSLALAAALLVATHAQAQLRLPSVTLPSLPRPAAPLQEPLQQRPAPLADLRRNLIRELVRLNPDLVEVDPNGEPMRRQELVLIASSAATVEAARVQGFTVLRERVLAELDLLQWIVRPPAGMSPVEALARLRAIDPEAQADFNHLYTRSGEVLAGASSGAGVPTAAGARRLGLVDGGVDRAHPALRGVRWQGWGCEGAATPSAHGTAVASLLVGRDAAFQGAAPDSQLFAADVYCERPDGGSAEEIAHALAWLAREQVAVINVSLVGPPNKLLERAVQAMQRRGHLIVAAVGNDGPGAPPLYPAAYAGVVGVTGVDASQRVLPEAAQGPQVMFAAPGAGLAAARQAGGYADVRGTSFAAPLVAGLLAHSLREPNGDAAQGAVAHLARSAQDLGASGRDPVFGFGLVAEQARVLPGKVHARAR